VAADSPLCGCRAPQSELDECFERNSEGMLKNMAVHELALAVTYYGATVDQVQSVKVDRNFSVCETRGEYENDFFSHFLLTPARRQQNPVWTDWHRGVDIVVSAYVQCGGGGGRYTDFSKVAFTLTTKDGRGVRIMADRCGGNSSEAQVQVDGVEQFSVTTPDSSLQSRVEEQLEAEPEVMPYFFLQADDYISLKEGVAKHVLSGAAGTPAGFATLTIAIETMKLAEHLQPLLHEQLS
jgi:hypothetical protein